MDIRGPRLRKQSDRALAFTSSLAADERIAGQVIKVNMSHLLTLLRAEEVEKAPASKCIGFLLRASSEVSNPPTSEDYHQQLEQQAVDELGISVAGLMNYGKSRNDQVATAIRMELRVRLLDLVEAVRGLQSSLLKVAESDGTALVPAYTHLQRAQPVTLAHYMFAHFDSLQRDIERLLDAYSRVNVSPMGSAALAGTSVRVDRAFEARLLGFSSPMRNSIDGVSSRDFVAEAMACAAIAMTDSSTIAEEQILWSSSEFGFIELDDSYSASSSIMPQKKNPVVSEIVRAKTGSVLGSLVSVVTILKSLPYSYNLDLQEVTPHLWRAFDDAVSSMEVLASSVSTMKVNKARILSSIEDDGSTAVALANYLARNNGVTFRQAHSIVGQLVRISHERRKPLAEVVASDLPKISSKFGAKAKLDRETSAAVLDPGKFLSSIASSGGSNPRGIEPGIALRERDLAASAKATRSLKASLRSSERSLLTLARKESRR